MGAGDPDEVVLFDADGVVDEDGGELLQAGVTHGRIVEGVEVKREDVKGRLGEGAVSGKVWGWCSGWVIRNRGETRRG